MSDEKYRKKLKETEEQIQSQTAAIENFKKLRSHNIKYKYWLLACLGEDTDAIDDPLKEEFTVEELHNLTRRDGNLKK